MRGHQVLDDREAETEPTGGAIQGLRLLHEQIEHALDHLRADADPVVADADLDAIADGLRRDADARTRIAVLRGVRQQIREHLLQPRGVAIDEEIAGDVQRERLLSLLKQRLRGLDGALDDLGDRRALLVKVDLPAGDPRDVEQVVDQPHELLELALDDRQLLRRLAAQMHQLDGHHDRRQGISQLVAQHGQELVLGARRVLGRAPRLDGALEQLAAELGERDVHLHARDQLPRGERLDEVVVGAGL